MGKAQSKRSVDITTDVKKDDVLEEGTGKMGKIEDVDQLKPQVNGDTHHNETEGNEKEKTGDAEATENEKDLSTEKEQSKPHTTEGAGSGDISATEATDKPATTTTTVENGNDETLNESKTLTAAVAATAESSTANANAEATTNGDSNKKTKKEKLKKKWSFRSISFGKKDKQKPLKKDEETAVNGECEKVPEENTEETAQNKSTEQSPTETVKPAAEAVENVKTEENKETTTTTTPAVNGTETEAAATKDSPVTVDAKSSEIVPPAPAAPVENDVKDEKQSTDNKTVEAAAPPSTTEAPSNLKDVVADTPAPPAKIEEQPIPAPTSAPVTEVAVSKTESVPETIPAPVDEKPKEETQNQVSQEPSSTAVAADTPQKPAEEKPAAAITEEIKSASEEAKSQVSEVDTKLTVEPSETPASVPPQVEKEQPQKEERKVAEPPTEQKTESAPQEGAVDVEKTEVKLESTQTVESQEAQAIPAEASPAPPAAEEVKSPQEPVKEEPVTEKSVGNVAAETTDSPKPAEMTAVSPKSEGEINPEQIAETIALIDEVTQQALATTEQKPSAPEGGEQKIESVDDKSQAQAAQSEPCNASPLEGNISVSTDPETISSAITDSQIPPATPSPVVELGTEQILAEVVAAVTETTTAADTSAPSDAAATVASNEPEVGVKIADQTPKSEQTQVTPATATVEQKESTENKEIPKTESSATTNGDDEKAKEAATADPLQAEASKENGIGENHETSATESLNGQVEQKSAEEIKSEQKAAEVKVDGAPEVPVAAE